MGKKRRAPSFGKFATQGLDEGTLTIAGKRLRVRIGEVPQSQLLFFAENPRVLQTYQRARGIPAVLDGIYCHCRCKEERGHRSLLTCFQSQHGSGCDVCLGEAELAEAMAAQGKNLQEIRAQVDLAFGR